MESSAGRGLDADARDDVTPSARDVDVDALYQELFPKLSAVAYRVTGDRRLGDDLAHDAFVELLSHTGDQITNPAGWLTTVTWRRAVNAARNTRRLHVVADPTLHQPSTTTDLVDVDEGLADALASLPPNQRAAAVLVWGAGMTAGEAARIIGCATPTVHVHLHRARKTLRTLLGGQSHD